MIRYVFVYLSAESEAKWKRFNPSEPQQSPEEQQVILKYGTIARMIERMGELSGVYCGNYLDISLGTVYVFRVLP